MIKIKYNNSDEMYDVAYMKISNHVCKITGDIPISTSGFITYREDGSELGDRTDYTTVYRHDDGYVMYSNDGSVYNENYKPYVPIR